MKQIYTKQNRADHVRRFWLVLFFLILFLKRTRVFIEEDNPSGNVVIVEEGLDARPFNYGL